MTLAAAHDADALDGSAVVIHTATSADAIYDGTDIPNVTATEVDDDAARVDVSASRVPVPEGGTASVHGGAGDAAGAAVTLAVANRSGPDDDADLTASPATLTFTPATWDTPQTVTLAAAQDADALDGTAVVHAHRHQRATRATTPSPLPR